MLALAPEANLSGARDSGGSGASGASGAGVPPPGAIRAMPSVGEALLVATSMEISHPSRSTSTLIRFPCQLACLRWNPVVFEGSLGLW